MYSIKYNLSPITSKGMTFKTEKNGDGYIHIPIKTMAAIVSIIVAFTAIIQFGFSMFGNYNPSEQARINQELQHLREDYKTLEQENVLLREALEVKFSRLGDKIDRNHALILEFYKQNKP